MKKLQWLLCIFAMLPSLLMAVNTPNTADTFQKETHQTIKQAKKKAKLERKLEKLEHKLEAAIPMDIDLNDPVKKWLWFAALAYGLAIALNIIGWLLPDLGLFNTLGYFAGLAGTAFLIVWLIKYLG